MKRCNQQKTTFKKTNEHHLDWKKHIHENRIYFRTYASF